MEKFFLFFLLISLISFSGVLSRSFRDEEDGFDIIDSDSNLLQNVSENEEDLDEFLFLHKTSLDEKLEDDDSQSEFRIWAKGQLRELGNENFELRNLVIKDFKTLFKKLKYIENEQKKYEKLEKDIESLKGDMNSLKTSNVYNYNRRPFGNRMTTTEDTFDENNYTYRSFRFSTTTTPTPPPPTTTTTTEAITFPYEDSAENKIFSESAEFNYRENIGETTTTTEATTTTIKTIEEVTTLSPKDTLILRYWKESADKLQNDFITLLKSNEWNYLNNLNGDKTYVWNKNGEKYYRISGILNCSPELAYNVSQAADEGSVQLKKTLVEVSQNTKVGYYHYPIGLQMRDAVILSHDTILPDNSIISTMKSVKTSPALPLYDFGINDDDYIRAEFGVNGAIFKPRRDPDETEYQFVINFDMKLSQNIPDFLMVIAAKKSIDQLRINIEKIKVQQQFQNEDYNY